MRIFLLAAILLSSSVAYAGGITSFRCPDTERIVSLRMSVDTVATLCREPDNVSEHQETVWESSVTYVGRDAVVTQIPHEVTYTEWTLDFGHDRFVRYLTFIDGVLTRIREGGYGT